MTMTDGNHTAADFIEVGTGSEARRIAIALQPQAPGNALAHFVWLGGYRSDMRGTKALELEAFARANALACLRLDYSGHGESGGDFNDGTISRWLEEALAVIAHVGFRRLVLVGSSIRSSSHAIAGRQPVASARAMMRVILRPIS